MRDDAATRDVFGQRPDRVAGTAELERAHALQLFAFEKQLGAGELVETARAQHRRDLGMRRDARGGVADVTLE